jgi:hypothetical protein
MTGKKFEKAPLKEEKHLEEAIRNFVATNE